MDEHSAELENTIIEVRKKYKLKLPYAIVAATAITNNATLITNDKEFKKVIGLKIKSI
jgi:predicted nucleic acid-binding protein